MRAAVPTLAVEDLYIMALVSKGFLDTDIPGLPPELSIEIKKIVEATVEQAL